MSRPRRNKLPSMHQPPHDTFRHARRTSARLSSRLHQHQLSKSLRQERGNQRNMHHKMHGPTAQGDGSGCVALSVSPTRVTACVLPRMQRERGTIYNRGSTTGNAKLSACLLVWFVRCPALVTIITCRKRAYRDVVSNVGPLHLDLAT